MPYADDGTLLRPNGKPASKSEVAQHEVGSTECESLVITAVVTGNVNWSWSFVKLLGYKKWMLLDWIERYKELNPKKKKESQRRKMKVTKAENIKRWRDRGESVFDTFDQVNEALALAKMGIDQREIILVYARGSVQENADGKAYKRIYERYFG